MAAAGESRNALSSSCPAPPWVAAAGCIAAHPSKPITLVIIPTLLHAQCVAVVWSYEAMPPGCPGLWGTKLFLIGSS